MNECMNDLIQTFNWQYIHKHTHTYIHTYTHMLQNNYNIIPVYITIPVLFIT